jgi:proline iminopeptidase
VNLKTRAERLSGEDAEILKNLAESEQFKRLETQAVKRYLQISEKARFFNPELISKLSMDVDKEKIEKLMRVGQLMNPCLDDYDIVEKLKIINCPTLIIHGDYDPIPLESSEMIHHSIRGSELVVIEDCGHFPFVEAPEIFARAVESFLERTSE